MQWRVGPYRLDVDNVCLWQGEKRLILRPKTFEMLVYLVEHAGALVTKDDLLAAVWPETVVAENVLTVSMSELRKVLGETARAPQFIATVHRRGYRLIAPVEALDDPPVSLPSFELLDDTAASPAETPELTHAHPLILVDREAELAQLRQHLRVAKDGQRQVLFVTGEAGIGKTALADAFVQEVMASQGADVSRGQCIDHYGAGESYLPLLDALGQLLRDSPGTQLVDRLKQEAPSWLLQLPAFVPEAELDHLNRRASGVTRERMLRELAEVLETLTAERPLVLVLEDLHWSDVSTLDWLAYVARRRQTARLLIVGTYRPVDAVVRDHPVRAMTQELVVRGQGMELALDYLSEVGVAAFLEQRLGSSSVRPDFVQQLYQRTNGHPLFLNALVEGLAQQGVLPPGGVDSRDVGVHEVLELEVPEGIQQLIAQQFEALTPADQELLEAASVAGMEFASTAVAALLGHDIDQVETQFDRLARRGQFVASHGQVEGPHHTVAAQYQFRHSLYQQVVYDRVPVNRQVRWHRGLGAYLEALYGEYTQEIVVALAEHFARGRDASQAVPYLYRAGTQSLQRSAYQEAKAHFSRGLDLLPHLPAGSARDQQEIRLRTGLGPVLMTISGYGSPEVADNYTHAYALCQKGGETTALFPVLWGLWQISNARDRPQVALDLARQVHTVAQASQDPIQVLQGHHAMWGTLLHCGQYETSRHHIEQGRRLYRMEDHHRHAIQYGVDDPGVCCLAIGAEVLWYLGYADQAIEWAEEGIALAEALEHPFSLNYVLYDAVRLYLNRHDFAKTRERLEALVAVSTAHGFQYHMALAEMRWGALAVAQHQYETGIERIHNGLEQLKSMDALYQRPWFRIALAAAYSGLDQIDKGQAEIQLGLQCVSDTGHMVFVADLHRLQGILYLRQAAPDPRKAEASFRQALEVARHQKARSIELRVAINLAQLWHDQGRGAEALALLESVYESFTEGYDTGDMRHAKQLLHDLGSVKA